MGIGGQDVVLEVPFSEDLVDFVQAWFKTFWPNLDWERELEPGKDMARIFAHRDAQAREDWDDWGATDENLETMVYLVFEPDALCLTGEGETFKALGGLLDAIRGKWDLAG